MKNLIGKKVRGFKFDSTTDCIYISEMDLYLNKIGVISYHNKSFGNYGVTFEDGVCYVYPAELIHEHLVEEPELRKVWAWDNDPQEAFETYLIREFEGFEYPYLCVSEYFIKEFKNKQHIETDYFKNISETDPRIENDIVKLVEKYGKDRLITLIEKI